MTMVIMAAMGVVVAKMTNDIGGVGCSNFYFCVIEDCNLFFLGFKYRDFGLKFLE